MTDKINIGTHVTAAENETPLLARKTAQMGDGNGNLFVNSCWNY